VLIDRSTGGRFNNTSFFGLAVMFGAVGIASFMSASPVDGTSGISAINTGSRLSGNEKFSKSEPVSMKSQVEESVDNFAE